jgi:hypothetical protein
METMGAHRIMDLKAVLGTLFGIGCFIGGF